MMNSISIIGVEKSGAEIALQIIKQNLLTYTGLTIASVDDEFLNEYIIGRHEKFPPFTSFQFLKQFEGKAASDKIPFINSVFDEKASCVIVCADLEEEYARNFAPLIALDAMLKGKYVISVFSSPDFKCDDPRLKAKLQLTLCSHKTIEQNADVLRTVTEPEYSNPYVNLIEGFRMAINTDRPITRLTIGPKGNKPLIEIRDNNFHGLTIKQRVEIFDSLANSIEIS